MRRLKQLFRRFFPRLRHPLLDAEIVHHPNDPESEAAYRALTDPSDPFVAARYAEGQRWRQVLATLAPPPARILDIGAGDGAIELAFTAAGYKTMSVDSLWNGIAVKLGVRRVIADAAQLPFRSGVFDATLCFETIEHLHQPRAVSAELARVARGDAPMLLTTPARWRFALKGDPHFGIRGLLLLPPALQRSIAAGRGFTRPEHYVDRIYGSVAQIARAFPQFRVERVLSRTRTPRRWFWDAIILRSLPLDRAGRLR